MTGSIFTDRAMTQWEKVLRTAIQVCVVRRCGGLSASWLPPCPLAHGKHRHGDRYRSPSALTIARMEPAPKRHPLITGARHHQPRDIGLPRPGVAAHHGHGLAAGTFPGGGGRRILVRVPHPQPLPPTVWRRGHDGQLSARADRPTGKRSARGSPVGQRCGRAVGRSAGGVGGLGRTGVWPDLADLGQCRGRKPVDGALGRDAALSAADLRGRAVDHHALRVAALHRAGPDAHHVEHRVARGRLGRGAVVRSESGGPGVRAGGGGARRGRGASGGAIADAPTARFPLQLQLVGGPRRE